MIRAGVFIGVDRTGGLQALNDAASSAVAMHKWAIDQEMVDKTHAVLLTDLNGGRVRANDIYDAIENMLKGAGLDQLIVYFAGHGVNIGRNEHWLLSEAPVKTNEAVNVTGSVELARYSGIQHVVTISDACRVAPDGIQAQNVRGSDIFPNDTATDKAKPVDQFFACALGRTAGEIKDPAVAASNYKAVYTAALLDALHGNRPELLEPDPNPGSAFRILKPRKLEDYLETEVPLRIGKLNLQNALNQNPDALILDHPHWISRFKNAIPGGLPGHGTPGTGPGTGPGSGPGSGPGTPGFPEADLLDLRNDDLEEAGPGTTSSANELAIEKSRSILAAPFGPDHMETHCGIKVRGARIVDFFVTGAQGQILDNQRQLLRIDKNYTGPCSVLLEFEGGVGTLIPAIPEYLAALTFDEGELVDVAYEPSANSWAYPEFQQHAAEIRDLRALAAAASQHGRFRLDGINAPDVARRMQYSKAIDPTLAIYAAYAYYDLQNLDRIREMNSILRSSNGATFFDLALLARELRNKEVLSPMRLVPFAPLMRQGWALLKANKVHLHAHLDDIEDNLKDSLWTLYDAKGLDKLRKTMKTGEVL